MGLRVADFLRRRPGLHLHFCRAGDEFALPGRLMCLGWLRSAAELWFIGFGVLLILRGRSAKVGLRNPHMELARSTPRGCVCALAVVMVMAVGVVG